MDYIKSFLPPSWFTGGASDSIERDSDGDSVGGSAIIVSSDGICIEDVTGNGPDSEQIRKSSTSKEDASLDDVPVKKASGSHIVVLTNLNSLDIYADNLEIRVASKGSDIILSESFVKPTGWGSSFAMAKKAVSRSDDDREAYRAGMNKVRELLLDKYDSFAIERFDKHFALRNWSGKPLTVRALREFVVQEDEMRSTMMAMPVLDPQESHKTLEALEVALPSHEDSAGKTIIANKKSKHELERMPKSPSSSFGIAISTVHFISNKDREVAKKMRQEGIKAAREAVISSLKNDREKEAIGTSFDHQFAVKQKKGEAITVSELRSFIEPSIALRKAVDSWFNGIEDKTVEGFKEAGSAFKEAIQEITKGMAVGATLKVAADAGDPVTALIEGAVTGGTLTAETPLEEFITASLILLHSAPANPSLFNKAIGFLSFGLLA